MKNRALRGSSQHAWLITGAVFLITTGLLAYLFGDRALCTVFEGTCPRAIYRIEKVVLGALVSMSVFIGLRYAHLKAFVREKKKECFLVEQKYRVFLAEANDAIIVTNVHTGRVIEANKAAEHLFGKPIEKIVGMHRADIHPRDASIDHELLFASIIREGKMYADEISVVHASGRTIPVDMSASLITVNGSTVIVSILRNISLRLCAQREAERYIAELRELNARLNEQKRLLDEQAVVLAKEARTDVLTGLPNRNAFLERYDLASAGSKRYGHTVALMFIDLDKFKEVNDTFGHDAGDEFLKIVAKRGSIVCRRSTELFARLGGDEFVVLLPEVKDMYEAIAFAETLLRAFNEPFKLAGQVTRIEASIGIAIGAKDDDLLKRADEAMYAAKKKGNTYVVA